MRVLVISPLWDGLFPFFYDAKERCTGMPAFYELWIRMLESENIKSIDLILLYSSEMTSGFKVPPKFDSKLNIYPVKKETGIWKVFMIFQIIWVSTKLIFGRKYDRYLGFGSIGFFTSYFNVLRHARQQRRLFGISAVFEDLRMNKFNMFRKHPFSFLSLTLSCDHLFITNDGSHGDMVFEKFGNKKINFHFYFNGVNIINVKRNILNDYCSYIGRIYPWKGQLILVEAIGIIKEKYNVDIPVIFVGQVEDPGYLDQIKERILKYNLKKVTILKEVGRERVNEILRNSRITFSFYQTSNFGNVLIEAFKIGVPVLTRNVNDSLNPLPDKSYVGVESYDPKSIAEKLFSVYSDENYLEAVGYEASKFANENFMTWEERIRIELLTIIE